MNLKKMSWYQMKPNMVIGSLKNGRRKSRPDQKQKIWPFWPNFGQIQQYAALNVLGLAEDHIYKKLTILWSHKVGRGQRSTDLK